MLMDTLRLCTPETDEEICVVVILAAASAAVSDVTEDGLEINPI